MPLTPYHLGPGLLLKGALGDRFSFATFTTVQVAIDLESLTNLLAGSYPVHHHLHSLMGALGVGLVVAVLGRISFGRLKAALAAALARSPLGGRDALAETRRPESSPGGGSTALPWSAALAGALVGSVSHVLLDAIMHADLQPLFPWRAGNPLLIEGSAAPLHESCLAVAVVGVIAWAVPVIRAR